MKKYITLMMLFLLAGSFFYANTVSFQSENYTGTVIYNENVKPGEAIFARMCLKLSRNSKKKNNNEPAAVLQLLKDDKKLENSHFYFINNKSKRNMTPEMLAGIPVSLWLPSESGYSIKIIFSSGFPGDTAKEIILPVSIQTAEWNNDSLNLDEKNSEIKQNMSPERLKQIEKLETILETIIPANVHSLKPFSMPVNSTNLTARCGDRRIYKYSDGKTTSSVHYGNDYEVPEGTDVFSSSDGKIVLAEFRISTGWTIAVEHLPGLYSLYYHLGSLNVKEGDFVKQGEKIALSGSTGLSTTPHLHWEVRLNSAAVKPEFFLNDFAFSNIQ